MTIEPYFFFWSAVLTYFGLVAYRGLQALIRIEEWQRAIAEDSNTTHRKLTREELIKLAERLRDL